MAHVNEADASLMFRDKYVSELNVNSCRPGDAYINSRPESMIV